MDSTAAFQEFMRFVLLKREQLEQAMGEKAAMNREPPQNVDNELRKWVLETDLYTLANSKPRDIRRRVEILERQRLACRKKLRISPDLPDPVPQVEAVVQAWIKQRDAQMIVRRSKALMRKARKQYILTQRAERYAMMAEGRTDVNQWRLERVLNSIERKKERKAELEDRKKRKAERKAARAQGSLAAADGA